MKRPRSPIVLAAMALAACSGEDAAPPATSLAQAPESISAGAPLVVYASPATADELAPALAVYAAAAGIPVSPHFVDGLPGLLRAGRDDPRADLVVLVGARAAAEAAEEGVLRPVALDLAADVLPPALRDPDGTWLGLAWRPALIARDVRESALPVAEDYAGLAEPAFAGKLCLSAFGSGANAAIVADLIDTLGTRPAERVVRGWLANAALPVFATEADLRSAIGAGRCAAGVVLAPADSPTETSVIRYNAASAPSGELWAAGVSRHAGRPDDARALLAWLVTEAELPAAGRRVATADLPARHPALTGALSEEAAMLAERAGYR